MQVFSIKTPWQQDFYDKFRINYKHGRRFVKGKFCHARCARRRIPPASQIVSPATQPKPVA